MIRRDNSFTGRY